MPNPYSPTRLTESRLKPRAEKADQPTGIAILAVLHIMGGGLLFITQLMLLANLEKLEAPMEVLGIPPLLLVAGVAFLCVIAVASGIGMWLGTRWGWWLMTFYYVYGICRNVLAMGTIVLMSEQLVEDNQGPEFYLVKHGVRSVVHLVILAYCFKESVLCFFDVTDVSKLRSLGGLSAICIVLTVVTSVISYFFG